MLDSRTPARNRLKELIERLAACLPEEATGRNPAHSFEITKSRDDEQGQERDEIAAYEAALAVASEGPLDDLLQRLVEEAKALVSADVAILTLTNENDTIERVVMTHGARQSASSDDELSVDGRWAVTNLKAGSALFVRSVAAVLPDIDLSVASMIGVPMELGSGWHGNLFVVQRTGGAFRAEHVRLLEILARHVVPFIGRSFTCQSSQYGHEQAEEQLTQLRTILDTLPAGVMVVLPPDGQIEWCNRTAVRLMFGDGVPDSTIPQIYRDFRWLNDSGDELHRSRHPGMRALRGEKIPNRALTLQVANGDQIPMRVQSVPILNSGGEVVRAVIMFFDVSRERAAEQVKDDFLSLISHEFRTPLTAIHGGAHLLAQQGESLDEETRAELLKDIGEESSRLDHMLANLLKVAEIMAGRFQASTEPILIAPFVNAIVGEFRRQAPRHELSVDVHADVPPAEGDPDLLNQILRNLYENAVKYSPGGGEIRTVISRHDGWIAIEVVDQGLGIAPDHVPHVFERFRRPGADPTVRGMGLGLYLSRLLVDAQGGRIRAASAGPGKGATFTVELPVVADMEQGS